MACGIARDRAVLAERLGHLRHLRGWNWADLAREAGIHVVQVQGIEEGRREPRFGTLIKLASALRLHALDELVGPLPLEAIGVVESQQVRRLS